VVVHSGPGRKGSGGIEGHRESSVAHISAAAGEQAKKFAVNLVPDNTGKTAAAPLPAAARRTSTRRCGLMMCEDAPQGGDGPGVVTGALQLGEGVPH